MVIFVAFRVDWDGSVTCVVFLLARSIYVVTTVVLVSASQVVISEIVLEEEPVETLSDRELQQIAVERHGQPTILR